MGNPAVSVVIRCFNEERHIGKLLAGIMHQTVKDVEIIVVDSGSTDSTCDIVECFPTSLIHIEPSEFSFGRALNIGCAAATAPIIAIASGHVYPVYHTWLEHILKAFTDPEVALVYGKQRGDDRTKFSEHQIFAKWFPDTPHPRQTTPFCNNANAAVRRSVWEQLPYDEELTGLEDLDWAKRAQEAGFALSYVPTAEIVHVHEETASQVFNRYRREAIALKKINHAAHFNLFDFLRLTPSNILSDYYHALQAGKFIQNVRSIPVFRLMQFWGTYRGYATKDAVPLALKRKFYYPRGFGFATPDARAQPNGDKKIVYEEIHSPESLPRSGGASAVPSDS